MGDLRERNFDGYLMESRCGRSAPARGPAKFMTAREFDEMIVAECVDELGDTGKEHCRKCGAHHVSIDIFRSQ